MREAKLLFFFGLLKRVGNVYTKIANDYSAGNYKGKLVLIVLSIPMDGVAIMDLLILVIKSIVRVHHSKNEFARGNSHINGIESFWGYAKTRLVNFKGLNKNMFKLHLKECEFRFNNRRQNLYKILLRILRKEPLKLS